jgi:hypothetical protein
MNGMPADLMRGSAASEVGVTSYPNSATAAPS